jgi:hypothetical protein
MRIVFAALAVTRLIETNTGWSIKKFVRTARRYRTIEIRPANKSCSPKTRFPMIMPISALCRPSRDRACGIGGFQASRSA